MRGGRPQGAWQQGQGQGPRQGPWRQERRAPWLQARRTGVEGLEGGRGGMRGKGTGEEEHASRS